MVRDRGASLTVRACRLGIIDFTKARIRDVSWWRRVNVLIEDMTRDDDLEVIKAAYQFHLSLVGNPQLTEESWKASRDRALELFNDLINVVHPWGARSTEQRKGDELSNLRRLYKQHVGDLDDPKFQAVIDKEVSRMRSLAEQTEVTETSEQRVDRLFRERIVGARRR